MYKKILITSLLAVIPMVLSSETWAASCAIENGPIPELAQYKYSVDARIVELSRQATGVCGVTSRGASASAERALETIDKALIQVPLFGNLGLDFTYTFKVLMDGNARAPVMRDGQIFYMIEQRINDAIATTARQCQLDGAARDGLIQLRVDNTTMENIFKQAVLDTPASTEGLSEENARIANAINTNYTSDKTAACKDASEKDIEQMVTRFQNAITFKGKKNESSLENWKVAIALFQGGGNKMTSDQYATKQRQLLQAELARQGMGDRTSAVIMRNFDCFKAESAKGGDSDAAVKARQQCLKNPIMGLETIVLPWRKKVDAAKTTDSRVYQVNQLDAKKNTLTSIMQMESYLSTIRSPTADEKTLLITNLLDLHISLVTTTDLLEKRIPVMQRNCMKGQPGIVGGCKN